MQTKPNSQHICAASWNRVSFVSAGGDCDRILPSPPPPPPPPPNSPARRAARPQGPRRAPPDCAAPAAQRRRRPHTVLSVCLSLCVCQRMHLSKPDLPPPFLLMDGRTEGIDEATPEGRGSNGRDTTATGQQPVAVYMRAPTGVFACAAAQSATQAGGHLGRGTGERRSPEGGS